MKLKIVLLFCSLVLTQTSYSQMNNNDTINLQAFIKDPIRITKSDESGNYWVIAGEDSSRLYHAKKLRKSYRIIDLTQKENLPTSIQYTTIQNINKSCVLVGTNGKFIYFVKNNRIQHLDNTFGLADSFIVSISKLENEDRVIIATTGASYVYTGYVNRRTPCFQRITTNSENTTPIHNFIENNVRLPLQHVICNIASPIDLSFREKKYITRKEINKIKEELKPGDILIRRNDDQLSNVGIPGFWTHAAIYVGSANELNEYFDSISTIGGLKPSEIIKQQDPKAFRKIGSKRFLILEAVGKGVMLNPVEHIAKSDYFAAFRPKLLNKEEIFKAILNAFRCFGMPYDYLFDFRTPDALVCSELVYRAYQTTDQYKGINFQLGLLSGEPFLSPNDIARQFAEEYKVQQNQLQLLFFYDAVNGKVARKTEAEFSESINR